MLTNQSEGARNWTNQRRVSVDQSERSSQNAMRGTDGIKGTVPSFTPFPSITQSRNDVDLCMKLEIVLHSEELSKNASIASRGRD